MIQHFCMNIEGAIANEPLTPTVKSVRERFAEHEVYFWEGNNE